MAHSISNALRLVAVLGITVATIVACGSSDDSTFNDGQNETPEAGPISPPLANPVDSGNNTNVPSCKPRTCADQGIECGPAGDGCGGILPDCGSCGAGLRCGGPNAPSKCVNPTVGTGCMPKSCADQGIECGQAGDGCGKIITCGTCALGKQCGSTTSPSKCVDAVPTQADGGPCQLKTKADYNAQGMDCGKQTDNCGGTVDLGTCTKPGEFCGGSGPSKCGVAGGGSCVPKTSGQLR